MKYQRKNGSLFNSPATTAAVFQHLNNAGCLNYLESVLEKNGNAGTFSDLRYSEFIYINIHLYINRAFFSSKKPVPTVYPLDIYARLCMIDNLERLGVSHHFEEEVRSVLDETYR